MKNEIEIAWAAGLFEGEGYCGLVRTYPVLSLGMVDKEVVVKFAKIIETGDIYFHQDNRENQSPTWVWRCTYRDDVVRTLEMLYPYLSTSKKERADRVIERAKSIRWHPRKNESEKMLKSLGFLNE